MTETAKPIKGGPSQLLKAARYNTFHDGVESDKQFLQDMKTLGKLCRNRRTLIGKTQQLTPVQCEDIATNAELHRDARRANTYYQLLFKATDLEEEAKKKSEICDKLKKNEKERKHIKQNFTCPCKCSLVRGNPVHLCSPNEDLQFLGSATNLFFFYTKVVIVLAFLLFVVAGSYGMATSILNGSRFESACAGSLFCSITSRLSIESRQDRSDLVLIDLWLIVAAAVLTCVVLRIAKYKACVLDLEIDKNMETPSDFAIKLENLPFGDYNEEQVLSFLRQLELRFDKDKNETEPIQYRAIHIVYNMHGARELVQSIEEQCMNLSRMIDWQGKLRRPAFREDEYLSGKLNLIESLQSLEDLRKKFLAEAEYRKSLATTCCIVEFGTEKCQRRFIQQYGNRKVGVLDQVKAWWSRVVLKEPGRYQQFKGRLLQIERAPQPEDVMWQNCEKVYSLSRIVMIWSVTLTIILLSFALVVGLDYLQVRFSADPAFSRSQVLEIINYAISVVLIVINRLLWVALLFLIKIEYNHTSSDQVISTVNKTIIAQALNSIALPIIVNLVLQNQMFGRDGLISQVLDYVISNCLVPIALLLVDPGYWIKKALLWFRWTRHISTPRIYSVIAHLAKGQIIDAEQKQKNYSIQVNKFYEGGDFNVTGSYVYLAGGLIYASFNSLLQPLILAILLVSTIIFYHLKKYLLLRRYNAPEMLSKLVFDNVLMVLSYVPVFQAVGGAVYCGFIFGWTRSDLMLPCAVTLFVALINLRNPWGCFDTLSERICKQFSKKTVAQQTEKKRRRTSMNLNHRKVSVGHNTIFEHAKRMADALEPHSEQETLLKYHHYNHLDTLLGYHRLIRGERTDENQAIKQQLKRFTEEVVGAADDRLEFPQECESVTVEPLVANNAGEEVAAS